MFALLVSSKGFCAADEEMPEAAAAGAGASAKPIMPSVIHSHTVHHRRKSELPEAEAGAAGASAKPIRPSVIHSHTVHHRHKTRFTEAEIAAAAGAGAGASSKPIGDILSLYPDILSFYRNRTKQEEKEVYDRYAAKILVIANLSTGPSGRDISVTLKKILVALKPGEEILITNIDSILTILAIYRCGVVRLEGLPQMHAAVFTKR